MSPAPGRFARAPLLVWTIAAGTLGLFSCGSIGEPLPPLLRIPAAVEDLEVRQQGDELVLGWTYPRLTTEGIPLEPLERFEAIVAPVAEPQPPTAETLEQIGQPAGTLAGDALAAASPGETVSLRLAAEPYYNRNLAVAVRSLSRRGRVSGLSSPRLIRPLEPPAAPAAPVAEVRAEGVSLEWPETPDVSGYLVERRVGSEEFEPLADAPEPRLLDPAPGWGEPHAYRVRARRAEPPWGETLGPASPPVAIQPLDRFPPAPPPNLRAVAGPRSIELAWSPSPQSDVAGYRVYRDGRLLDETAREQFAYSDEAASPGAAAEYSVSAVDKAGNESDRVAVAIGAAAVP